MIGSDPNIKIVQKKAQHGLTNLPQYDISLFIHSFPLATYDVIYGTTHFSFLTQVTWSFLTRGPYLMFASRLGSREKHGTNGRDDMMYRIKKPIKEATSKYHQHWVHSRNVSISSRVSASDKKGLFSIHTLVSSISSTNTLSHKP